jgi:Putative effector of murein hydrolase
MKEILRNSAYFGLMISLIGYEAGLLIKKKYKLSIFNPLMLSIIFVMLAITFFKVDYQSYYNSAKYISYLLTPATICLAIPLYEQYNLLKKNLKAIMIGVLSGVLASLTSVLLFAVLFRFNHTQYVTLLPKSITTAIGIGMSEEMGGIVTITIASIIITGITGNIFAELFCKKLKIVDPVARGIAIGTSSHALGTSKAMELGDVEGAMSSLSIVVAGLITVIGAIAFSYFL